MSRGDWNIPGERPKFQLGTSAFRDMPYAETPYPSREMRLLAAIRMWGILRYFSPAVALMGDKWDDVLVEFLPRFSEAKDVREYNLAAAEMAARTGDPECAVRSAVTAEFFGPATAPFEIRFIENQPVVTRIFKPNPAQVGDVILAIDGKPVQSRIDELSHLIPASSRAAKNQATLPAARDGEAVRLIDEHTGYVDLERVDTSEIEALFQKLLNTPAIIFDLRGYPRNQAMTIAARLGDRDQPVTVDLFRNVVGIGSGDRQVSFRQSELRAPRGQNPRYMGKTVALIDDVTPSITGEVAMTFKAVNNTILIGSTTFPIYSSSATMFDVPGGIKTIFSGEMPHWPGGRAVYPEGVRPDVEVRPTLAGIRAGRDEILEAAIAYLKEK
jgi:hypothetical protein